MCACSDQLGRQRLVVQRGLEAVCVCVSVCGLQASVRVCACSDQLGRQRLVVQRGLEAVCVSVCGLQASVCVCLQ